MSVLKQTCRSRRLHSQLLGQERSKQPAAPANAGKSPLAVTQRPAAGPGVLPSNVLRSAEGA
ncbi:hypothetical protein ABIE91_001731 [Bradyrhizobium elkanii]